MSDVIWVCDLQYNGGQWLRPYCEKCPENAIPHVPASDLEALKAENAKLRKLKDCAEALVASASDDPLSARDALVDSQELADLEKALAANEEG